MTPCNGFCRVERVVRDWRKSLSTRQSKLSSGRGVARGGFQGFRNPPSCAKEPPLLFLTVILSQQECNGLSIPEILDHLQSEMKAYFNPTNDAVLSSLFNLLPELVAVGDRNPDIEAALEFYENDLPSPHVVDAELL